MVKTSASGRTQDKGTVFPHTDLPRPVNNFFFCLLAIFRWDV